ncbi:MAG: hypothetical protein KAS32_19735 [Candidatus Peribacteraceae bacterium]|nr:hypothetical protein [Candidatus Peribacteraceae bacterium]
MVAYHSKGKIQPQFLLDLPYRDRVVCMNEVLKEIEAERKEQDKLLAKFKKK